MLVAKQLRVKLLHAIWVVQQLTFDEQFYDQQCKYERSINQECVSLFNKGNGNTWSHPQLDCVCTVYTVYILNNSSVYRKILKTTGKEIDFYFT